MYGIYDFILKESCLQNTISTLIYEMRLKN